MPFFDSSSARRMSSVQRLLPPSITMSPSDSSSASSVSTGSMACTGTITQTIFGWSVAVSLPTMSARSLASEIS